MPSKTPTGRQLRHTSDLTPGEKRFLALCQSINYGRLRKLQVRDGQPAFDPPPRVVRERKFGAQRPNRARGAGDFHLKPELVEFFDCLHEIGDGVIPEIEVRYGLPFRAVFNEEDG